MSDKTPEEIAAEKREAEDAAKTAAAKPAAKKATAHRRGSTAAATAFLAASDKAEGLEGVEEFIVVHPKMSIYVGGEGEDEETIESIPLPGDETAPVVDGWVVVPKGTRLRATTDAELADFRLKVQLGFLTGAPAS